MMKNRLLIIAISIVLISSCTQSNNKDSDTINKQTKVVAKVIKDTTIDIRLLTYQKKTSTWLINGKPYTGFVVTKFENDEIKRRFGVLNGKKQNEDIIWFDNGKINSIANYHKGKLHGEKKIWKNSPKYSLVAHYNYNIGKGHGKQTKWYPTGELFQIINLKMGKENGLQQAFRKNGALYANYEAVNGRIFGLKRAALCFGLDDENIQKNE